MCWSVDNLFLSMQTGTHDKLETVMLRWQSLDRRAIANESLTVDFCGNISLAQVNCVLCKFEKNKLMRKLIRGDSSGNEQYLEIVMFDRM